MSNVVDFLHADKNQGFFQMEIILFDEFGQA